jgi:very-short-patch-repair endonuclease
MTVTSWSLRAQRRGGKLVYDDVELLRLECCRGHAFALTPRQLARDEWCRLCDVSEGERRVSACLKRFSARLDRELVVHRERRFPAELRYLGALRLDFYVPALRLVIEYDGRFHFLPSIGGNARFVHTLERDAVKDAWCASTGRSMLRVPFWRLEACEALVERALLACVTGERVLIDEAREWRAACLALLRAGAAPLAPPDAGAR